MLYIYYIVKLKMNKILSNCIFFFFKQINEGTINRNVNCLNKKRKGSYILYTYIHT